MEATFISMLEDLYGLVNETTTSVVENVEDANLKTNLLNQLEEALVTCVTTQHKVAITRHAVKETIARAEDENTKEPNSNLYDDLLEESIGELQMDSPIDEVIAQSAALKSFKELLEENNVASNPDPDGDLIATQYSSTFLDPISKKRMTDPVRNKICDHVYDRGTITVMIAKSKQKLKCPIIGCANRKPIKLSDLKEAPDVKRQLALQEKRQ
ncbi:E3 SUMO-protein ligase NSE2-like [Portunus trituberculatus]|uniref:E3 SUMO-protein ligase NSE2-like n=1 Tax=Portunus trituberculatus TaxID=210409 RepID=UPI001E1CEAD1|nr:E3 SUMO-protein ligase NSE2-like [Portunus trituberculatus]